MLDIAVIEDPRHGRVVARPGADAFLEALAEGRRLRDDAGERVGLPRQLVNYHLRTLERHGLVELEAERRKGNVTERVMRASAGSYVISPAALTGLQPDPGAVARSALRRLAAGAGGPARPRRRHAAGRRHPRATRLCPRSPWTRRSGSRAPRTGRHSRTSSAAAVTSLISRYHDDAAPRGRTHRVLVAIHPSVPTAPRPLPQWRPDMTHPFRIEVSVEIEATPEEVWEALTVGEQLDGWWIGAPNDGRAQARRHGPPDVRRARSRESTVTAWDPPHRFADAGTPGPDGVMHALEFTVEGRSGTHDRALRAQRLPRRRLGGRVRGPQRGRPDVPPPAGGVRPASSAAGPWPSSSTSSPGIADRESGDVDPPRRAGPRRRVALGDAVRLEPAGLGPSRARSTTSSASMIGLRTDDALYRFAFIPMGGGIYMGHHVYRDDVDVAAVTAAWAAWLAEVFTD